ncbi:hypothetical protein [Neoaquamicrobium sediminum]|uniref:hypothetical protein n=1 Tax=Neoaquamicrobium sediminum TaxID=1849104 RepID=UPI003BA9C904
MNIGLMLFGMRHDVERIADKVASDFSGPEGPIPIERLLRRRHREVVELRDTGLAWEQISRLLAGAGVVRRDGRAFPASHLRGVFSRHRKRNQLNQPKKSRTAATASSTAGGVRPRVEDNAQHPASGPWLSNSALEGSAAVAHMAANEYSPGRNSGLAPARQEGDGQGAEQVGKDDASTVSDRERVLALMRQSALARRIFE